MNTLSVSIIFWGGWLQHKTYRFKLPDNGREIKTIEYIPKTQRYRVIFHDWTSTNCNPSQDVYVIERGIFHE